MLLSGFVSGQSWRSRTTCLSPAKDLVLRCRTGWCPASAGEPQKPVTIADGKRSNATGSGRVRAAPTSTPADPCLNWTPPPDCLYTRVSQREGRDGTKSSSSPGIEELRERLHIAETLLRRFLPDVDLASLDSGTPASSAGRSPTQYYRAGPDAGAPPDSETSSAIATTPTAAVASDPSSSLENHRARFIPLVENANQLDRTDTGEYNFHGMSSGAAFLNRITQYLPGLPRYDSRMPFLPQPPRPSSAFADGHPSERQHMRSPWSQLVSHGISRLPLRQLAHDLCEYAFSRASCLLRVVHTPSFWAAFERLYEERPQRYTLEQQRFVGLLFSAMALGSMYDVDENDPTNPDHYAVAIERGYHYYSSARHSLQDITECCDMTTLQALVFTIQFLQATGNLNGCHTFVGIALRAALRMGLHRHLPHTALPPIEDETRRRLFHTIRSMDIYLSATLGLPLLLKDKDVDQRWPTEVVDDEDITAEGVVRVPPPGMPSFLEAFNAHARLMQILAKVVEYIYPPTGTDKGPRDVTYMISVARIKEIEQELHDWQGRLSPTWRAGPQEVLQITRVKILLRFAYAHVQMMLYRPFLQYYSSSQRSPAATTEHHADERYLALATAGINVCRNIIHIGLEIRKQAVLIGPYWFITYTQFFAVLSLLLYVVNNPNQPGAFDLFADAKLGKDCISSLTQRSLAADRVTVALNVSGSGLIQSFPQSIFDHLPVRFRSAEFSTARENPYEASSCENSHTRFLPGYVPPSMPTAAAAAAAAAAGIAPQRPWHVDASISSPGSPTSSRGVSMEALQHARPLQQQQQQQAFSGHHHYQPTTTNPMDFLLNDPFEYPVLPGVSLADDGFGSLHDNLQLPLYEAQMDLEGQFLHSQDM
ncbi:fungal-specific transcription factor domain-containing protein [Apiospora phragmitis]|uniref:Fungal-specific transcription factor domain-containing protein n=1 Tax=Apiospora phragmitis TaxID=2905665 RepID=A0ABR1TBA9_9PEZI